ncbi:MAG: hypothetical protein HKM07_05540 [Chlamydiae bacterium]|nr:hypothetical protein [Chlamydiota bacterium]
MSIKIPDGMPRNLPQLNQFQPTESTPLRIEPLRRIEQMRNPLYPIYPNPVSCDPKQPLHKPPAQTDLEIHTQEFVVQTKLIQIVNHPHAFNPSIIRWNGGILLCFRELDDWQKSYLGLVWVDEAMRPISPVQMLSTEVESGFEDVRLVAVQDKLYIVYSGTPSNPPKLENDKKKLIGSSGYNVRIRAAELVYDKEFSVHNDESFIIFDGENPNRPEKNWVPFEHNGELLFSYSLSPHKVLRPIWGTGRCETVSPGDYKIESHLGELRGGTPGILLENGKILSFFHTQKHMESRHSLGQPTPHYFMGAYLYSSDMPFEITHISPEPIVGPGFYNGRFYKPHWHSVNVVFPGGFIMQESDGKKYAWVLYGRQDHEIWAAKIDVDNLLKSLVEVKNPPSTLPKDFSLTQFLRASFFQELREKYEERGNRVAAKNASRLSFTSKNNPLRKLNPNYIKALCEDPSKAVSSAFRNQLECKNGSSGRVVLAVDIKGQTLAFKQGKVLNDWNIGKRLSDPRFMECYTIFRTEEGDSPDQNGVLVMEFIDGKNLFAEMQSWETIPDTFSTIFLELTQAFRYLISEKILPHDLHPGNIMVKPNGAIKCIDYGHYRSAGETIEDYRIFSDNIIHSLSRLLLAGELSTTSIEMRNVSQACQELMTLKDKLEPTGSQPITEKKLLDWLDQVVDPWIREKFLPILRKIPSKL